MIKIPPNSQWQSNGKSDTFGSLYATSNIDLQTNKGVTRVSPRMLINTNNITDLGTPVAFTTFTDQNVGVQYNWTVAGGYVFRASTGSGYTTAFAKDSSSGTPNNLCSSDVSDMASYGRLWLVVSATGDIYRYNASAGTWNDGTSQLGTGVHMLTTYGQRFYVTGNNTSIFSFTPADYAGIAVSGSNTLNLANNAYPITSISTIKTVSDGIWVFTINQSENGCWAFKWDGATANDPNLAYIIPDSSGVLASVIKNDAPWILDNNGRLMYFNGGTFVEAPSGRLPVRNTKQLKNPLSAVNDRWVHPNGMNIVDGRIRVLVNNQNHDNGATIEDNIASGIWEYDETIGWVHINSLSYHASTAGSVTDYGQNRIVRAGALYSAKSDSTSASANGTMLAGAQFYTNATATANGIFTNDSNNTLQKYGYLVTSKIFSSNVQDTWQSVYLRFKKLFSSADSIAVKYRINEVPPMEATITWTSTTTFTTPANISAYAIGDEVEIVQGTGGGKCAHITAILNAAISEVTLDDTFTGATGTAKARFQKWIKAGQTFSNQTSNFEKFSMQPQKNTATWIQYKVCMQFTGDDELNDLTVINAKHE